LEGSGGYVSPYFKLMLHYVDNGIPDKFNDRDLETWIKQNGNILVPELSKSDIDKIKTSKIKEMFRQIKRPS
jgi:hypothetical protein